jgi:hypothetical protein
VALSGAVTIATGHARFSRDRPMLLMAAALYAFVMIGTVSTLVNRGHNYGWALVSGFAFLSFPFAYSVWKISDKSQITMPRYSEAPFHALAPWSSAPFSIFCLAFAPKAAPGIPLFLQRRWPWR